MMAVRRRDHWRQRTETTTRPSWKVKGRGHKEGRRGGKGEVKLGRLWGLGEWVRWREMEREVEQIVLAELGTGESGARSDNLEEGQLGGE